MSNTLLRQWAMLKRIPRLPSKISTRELLTELNDEGYSVSQRTVQRDLKILSGFFPDLRNDGSKDYAEPEGKPIKLTALFTQGAAHHLRETPLSADQQLTDKKDGRVQVSATVKDSQQLRWWLLGFGDQVEVVRPKGLREEFRAVAEAMRGLYG